MRKDGGISGTAVSLEACCGLGCHCWFASSAKTGITSDAHCWTSQQWHPRQLTGRDSDMTHGLTDAQFLNTVASFLGPYYIVLALMNGIAARSICGASGTAKTWFNIRAGGQAFPFTSAIVWLLVAFVFVICRRSPGAAMGRGCRRCRNGSARSINRSTGPVVYSVGTVRVAERSVRLPAVFRVKPTVAWVIWNLMLLFLGLSMTDRDFYEIVGKPDNVPIVMLVLLLGYFTWLATYRAVINDDRIARGERRSRSSTTRRCSCGPTWSTPS